MNEELEKAANIAQFISLFLLLQDASNNDLMQELQHQNTEYFETIIKNQEKIIKLLEGMKNDL